MSALPLKADKAQTCWHVCLVPKADICSAAKKAPLLDHLIGGGEQRRRHLEAECLGGREIDHQLELDWGLNWKLAWFRALEDAITMPRSANATELSCISRRSPRLQPRLCTSPFYRVPSNWVAKMVAAQ